MILVHSTLDMRSLGGNCMRPFGPCLGFIVTTACFISIPGIGLPIIIRHWPAFAYLVLNNDNSLLFWPMGRSRGVITWEQQTSLLRSLFSYGLGGDDTLREVIYWTSWNISLGILQQIVIGTGATLHTFMYRNMQDTY